MAMLVSNLTGNLLYFSPLSIMLSVDFLYMAIIMLRYVPSIPSLLRVVYLFIFTMKGCCIWSNILCIY